MWSYPTEYTNTAMNIFAYGSLVTKYIFINNTLLAKLFVEQIEMHLRI